MPAEIERKFLVTHHDPSTLGVGDEIEQRYLRVGDPEVRVRRRGEGWSLTVKRGSGLRREEHETGLEPEMGRALLEAAGPGVRKWRHVIGRWEVDVYAGRFEGLVVVEVELEREDEALPDPPDGVTLGAELTEEPRFRNAELATLDEEGARALVDEVTGGP